MLVKLGLFVMLHVSIVAAVVGSSRAQGNWVQSERSEYRPGYGN